MYVECRKKFLREITGFLFVSYGLLGFLDGVSESVFAVLECATKLFSVKSHVDKRDVSMLPRALREGEFRKKKEIIAMRLLQPCWISVTCARDALAASCFDVSGCVFLINTWANTVKSRCIILLNRFESWKRNLCSVLRRFGGQEAEVFACSEQG